MLPIGREKELAQLLVRFFLRCECGAAGIGSRHPHTSWVGVGLIVATS